MTTDLMPEHSARPYGGDSFPEVEAAYRYVDSVVQHADAISSTGIDQVPAWHGWALREAFLAGCSHVHSTGGYIVPTVEESGPRRLIAELAALRYTAGTEKASPNWGEQHEADKLRYALRGFLNNKKPDSEAAYIQGTKDGMIGAVQGIIAVLEEDWEIRLLMRIMPLSILRKVAERLPAALEPLQPG
jgi:hypothetical protein